MPTETGSSQSRKKNRTNSTTEDATDAQCDKENASVENSGARKSDIEQTADLEVTLPEPTKNISMNSLLSPLNKVYSETKDNNLNRIVVGMLNKTKKNTNF